VQRIKGPVNNLLSDFGKRDASMDRLRTNTMPEMDPGSHSFVQPISPFIGKEKMASTGGLAMKNKMGSPGDLSWNLGNSNRKSRGYSLIKGQEG
jgi:hypothetical protein